MVDQYQIRTLDAVGDGELVRRIYSRSWPTTSRSDFSADEIIDRLGARDALWWQRNLAQSPIRLGGGPVNGGFGFALAAFESRSWDLTYLFCEPTVWGTGLADALHDAALTQLRSRTLCVGAWILHGNSQSQKFLSGAAG